MHALRLWPMGLILVALLSLGSGCQSSRQGTPTAVSSPVSSAKGASERSTTWPRYSLRLEKAWLLGTPGGERFDASGLLSLPDGTLLTVNDRGASLYRIRFPAEGDSVTLEPFPNVFTEPQLAPYHARKHGRYDAEGIAQDEMGRLYICEEADRWILCCDPKTQKVEVLNINWMPVQKYFSKSDGNASFEGVAVGGGRIYVANERQRGRIIVVDPATRKVVDDFAVRPAGNNARDLHYSDLCWYAGHLYVLLRESRVVLEVDPSNHAVVAEYDYASVELAPEFGYRSWYPTGAMEGLAVTKDAFWLVTDNNGFPRTRAPGDIRPTLFRCPRPTK